jgi:hypothetical protein
MPLLQSKNNIFNFDDWINPVGISYLPFTMHMGYKRKCFPGKMVCDMAVVSDVEKEIFGNNLIILELMFEEDVSLPATVVTLTTTIFLPGSKNDGSAENLSHNASSIFDHLEYFLPFLKENIVFF